MTFDNLKAPHYSEKEMQEIANLLMTLESKLKPAFNNINSIQLKNLDDISDQNISFVNKIENYRSSHPELSNPDIDWEEYKANSTSSIFLESAVTILEHMTKQFSENKTIHRYNNYLAAMSDYEYSERKACRYVSGYHEKANDIDELFDKGLKKTS